MSAPLLLTVDDNIDDALLLRHACKKGGVSFEFMTVPDGSRAIAHLLQTAAAGARLPFLVLLDLSMPVMNGFEVLERVRRNAGFRDLKISIFTSSENRSDIAKSYEQGADYYIAKPSDIQNLITLVRGVDASVSTGEAHPWQSLRLFSTFKPNPGRPAP